MGFDLDLWAVIVVVLTFAVGGFVKGLLSFGLPLVMVPPLSLVFPVPTAVALVTLPILLSNAWQMLLTGGFRETLVRLWPLIATLLTGLVLSTHFLVELDETVVLLIAAGVVLAFVAVDLAGFTITVHPRHERLIGAAVGAAGGLIGGLTSFFGTPPLMFLHALQFPKDRFVQASSVILFAGGVTLTAMLAKLDVLAEDELALSAAGLVPLFVGLTAGQRLRKKIDQALFRRLVLLGLLCLGISMAVRALSH